MDLEWGHEIWTVIIPSSKQPCYSMWILRLFTNCMYSYTYSSVLDETNCGPGLNQVESPTFETHLACLALIVTLRYSRVTWEENLGWGIF